MATDAQARADKRYEGHISRLVVKFDDRDDRDSALIDWARETGRNSTAYVKSLITADLGIDERRDWRVEVFGDDDGDAYRLDVVMHRQSTVSEVAARTVERFPGFAYADCRTVDGGREMVWTVYENGGYNREMLVN